MNYSLVNVFANKEDGKIDGSWIQDCCGVTLDEAISAAKATEAANGNRIRVAVVNQLSGTNLTASPVRTGLVDLRTARTVRKAVHIQWDVDDPADISALPDEILIPENLNDDEEISDYISDMTGFCHRGFEIKEEYEKYVRTVEDRK